MLNYRAKIIHAGFSWEHNIIKCNVEVDSVTYKSYRDVIADNIVSDHLWCCGLGQAGYWAHGAP